MYEVLAKYIRNKTNVTDAELDLICKAFTQKKLRKKQYLLQEGDVAKYGAFVCKGFLRLYSIDPKGGEHIIQFASENWWIGDRESIINKTPSMFNIDAIEDAELLLFTVESMEKLHEKVPAMQQMFQQNLINNFAASQRRINAAISFTAQEKYDDFVDRYPEIVKRAPQQMIASCLGMTRETLSRLRGQIAKSKA